VVVERAIFKELNKRDWVVLALCLATSIFFGVCSVKLAITYRADHAAPFNKDWKAPGG
jgi:hypothetical protein